MKLEQVLDGFDYGIECDDFLLYELGRLIEDDRASLDDEEFREIIDEGIHEHIDTRLSIRAEVARRLRTAMPEITTVEKPAAQRVLRAIEDIEFPLRDVGTVLKSYTTYLFRKLEECTNLAVSRESEIADALFESMDDRSAVEAALHTLGSIRSSVSARILAHLVSEPMLEEDLEMRAYELVRGTWPLARHYILYSLKSHTHEDIPFRWFQLLIEQNDPEGVERIMEELRAHGEDPNFREDLLALVELLSKSSDPQTEDKVMQVLNDPQTPAASIQILEQFLKGSSRPRLSSEQQSVWKDEARRHAANRKYQAAAKLLELGRSSDAAEKLDEILKDSPDYPFAVMLKKFL
jgi:hypothetical protein